MLGNVIGFVIQTDQIWRLGHRWKMGLCGLVVPVNDILMMSGIVL
jgi:hypothetical protein